MALNTIEQHCRVDVRPIMRACHGQTATVKLFTQGELYCVAKVNTQAHSMQLNQQCVEITTTACNYGGVRWWLVCPACERRCAVLYLHGVWLCRQCLHLNYHSQQATSSDCWTWYQKAEQIARRVDPAFRITDGFEAAHAQWWYFPKRPKGMHWDTYEQMRTKFLAYCERGGRELYNGIGSLLR